VVSKGLWAREDCDHICELFPIGNDMRAVRHTSFDGLDDVDNVCESGNNIFVGFLREVTVGILRILDNGLTVVDTFVDVIEALGVESTLEETTNDLLKLSEVIILGGSFLERDRLYF